MIYFIQAEGIGHIKIGFTDGEDAVSRLATLQTGSPVPLRVLHTMPGTLGDEKDLHRRFASAGVGGEWFRPIPELLALIPSVERKACGGVEIAERSVSIRVLTVGRKQFTKTLLYQFPEKICFAWDTLIDDAAKNPAIVEAGVGALDMTRYVASDVWGWLNLGQVHVENLGSGDVIHGFSTVVFAHENCLCRGRMWNSPPYWKIGFPEVKRRLYSFVSGVHERLKTIPGFRSEDQLFFGT